MFSIPLTISSIYVKSLENYTFIKGDLADQGDVIRLFQEYSPHVVVNLGAQAGVRYSIDNPTAYMAFSCAIFQYCNTQRLHLSCRPDCTDCGRRIQAESAFFPYMSQENRMITFQNLKVAVLGLAFKAGTDDLREAPSLDNVQLLLDSGANIYAYDPVAADNFKARFPEEAYGKGTIQYVSDKTCAACYKKSLIHI